MARLSVQQKHEIKLACTHSGAMLAASASGILLQNLTGMPLDWPKIITLAITTGAIGAQTGEKLAEIAISSYENLTGN
jgi:hypothetical protein